MTSLKMFIKRKIKEIITAIMYFIYPKKKDFQKVLVISIGYYSGIFLLNNYMDIELFCNSFFNMIERLILNQ